MENIPTQPDPNSNNLNNSNQDLPPKVYSSTTSNNANGSVSTPPKRIELIKATIVFGILLLILSGVLFFMHNHSKHPVDQVSNNNACINHSLALGSTGNCVSDLQTMLNFLETDDLNECPFKGAQTTVVNGSFDAPTQQQVKVVQTWLNCYNKQEGAPTTSVTSGVVNSATWPGICTYAYIYPKQAGQSSSPYYKESLAAGKNAGC